MRIVCQQTILMKYHSLFFLKIRKMLQNLLSAAVDRGVEILKLSTCSGTSKWTLCTCPKKILLVQQNRLAYTFLRPSQGGGYLFPCSPEINWLVPLFQKNRKHVFLCSLFPKIVFVPLFPSKFGLCSPVPLK